MRDDGLVRAGKRGAAAALVVFAALASPAGSGESPVPSGEKHPMDANPPLPAGQIVQLSVAGGAAAAYEAVPTGTPIGAVLVLHEWWGLNDWVKSQADELAKLGYAALAPDLYGGKVAKTPDEAGALMKALDQDRATRIETAALSRLAAGAPQGARGFRIATLGWCMGGSQSLLASLAAAEHVAATVIYYGAPVVDAAKLRALRGPVLGIWAKRDGWITPDKVSAFDRALSEAGVTHAFHTFDADHAFANPSGGRFNGPAAGEAWKLTTEFLAANLK